MDMNRIFEAVKSEVELIADELKALALDIWEHPELAWQEFYATETLTKFLQEHDNLTDEQELFLEEITDFFVENIENIEHDKTFLKRIEMGPIDLSKKKVKVKV